MELNEIIKEVEDLQANLYWGRDFSYHNAQNLLDLVLEQLYRLKDLEK